MALETTPEIERLADEIRAHGNYASQADVLGAALQLLKQQQDPPPHRRQAQRGRKSWRRKWAIGMWAVQVLTTIIAALASAADVESIIATLPILALTGLGLALLARPLGSWAVLAYSLSGPLVSAMCAALIAAFQWSQRAAQLPITTILFFYALYSLPAALLIAPALLRWPAAPSASKPLPRQFSLKSLLLLTTAMCIALPTLGFVFRYSDHPDYLTFALFTLAASGLAALTLTIFLADRYRQKMTCQDADDSAGGEYAAE